MRLIHASYDFPYIRIWDIDALSLGVDGNKDNKILSFRIIDNSKSAAFAAFCRRVGQTFLIGVITNAAYFVPGRRSRSSCVISFSATSNTAGYLRANRSTSLSKAGVVSTRVSISRYLAANFIKRFSRRAGFAVKSLAHTGTDILQNILSGWLIMDIRSSDVSTRLVGLSGAPVV